MVAGLGFSLQGNAKVTEGRQHEDRDAQFRYINDRVGEFLAVRSDGAGGSGDARGSDVAAGVDHQVGQERSEVISS
jgi:hypothetical protein